MYEHSAFILNLQYAVLQNLNLDLDINDVKSKKIDEIYLKIKLKKIMIIFLK